MTISLCMIVKNEEAVLERCLLSIREVADEIIIVDTGSCDRTKEIALKFTEKVYDFEWIDDFSAARNYAFSKASCDYQMWLDADDVLAEAEREKLSELKNTLPRDIDIVTMKYDIARDENGNPLFTSIRERLLKREKNYLWQGVVHECIPLIGNIYHSDITVTHKKEKANESSGRNLKIYETLEKNSHEFSPRHQYYYARELFDHGEYDRAVKYFEMFLDGGFGWFEDNIGACLNLSRCYIRIGRYEEVLPALFRSFNYDSPRAEICCQIAYFYKNSGDFKKAASWFKIALNLSKPDTLGFLQDEYWGYIPSIELSICCFEMGDLDAAQFYNEEAARFKPESKAVLYNRSFFEKINKNSG